MPVHMFSSHILLTFSNKSLKVFDFFCNVFFLNIDHNLKIIATCHCNNGGKFGRGWGHQLTTSEITKLYHRILYPVKVRGCELTRYSQRAHLNILL